MKQNPDLLLALRGALVGVAGLLVISVLPAAPTFTPAGMMLAAWLCIGSILAYVVRHRAPSQSLSLPPIPVEFSGPTGRFSLLRRGDGRHVEVLAAGDVVAEVKATDVRDEIELHHAVAPDELEDLGRALGQAIELAADADDAHLDWDDHGLTEGWRTDQPASSGW